MHGEFLSLLFLQAHRETAAHFNATGLPSPNHQSDNAFRLKRAAFYQLLKGKGGLAAAKAAALRINLNVEGCGIVAALALRGDGALGLALGSRCCLIASTVYLGCERGAGYW